MKRIRSIKRGGREKKRLKNFDLDRHGLKRVKSSGRDPCLPWKTTHHVVMATGPFDDARAEYQLDFITLEYAEWPVSFNLIRSVLDPVSFFVLPPPNAPL